MDNTVAINLPPISLLLTMIFQIWLVVFPIIIIRKLNYLTTLIQSQYESDTSENNEAS